MKIGKMEKKKKRQEKGHLRFWGSVPIGHGPTISKRKKGPFEIF